MNEFEIIDAFEKAMREAGIVPAFKSGEGIQFGHGPNGKPRRFHITGDSRGTRNGWYILFADGVPAGEFGSWKTGESISWCSKEGGSLTPDEQAAIRKRMEEARIERDKIQKASEGEAAKLANLIWNDATEVFGDDHPYLKRKGVVSHGLRTCSWPVRNKEGEVFRHIENTLIIPIMDSRGKITSLQAIFPAKDSSFGRDKDFLLGGKKRGCFYIIGRMPAAGGTVVVCEGYATAETIHQATGYCCVIAWDAYNIPHVAKVMREEMPHNIFLICADNDQFTKKPVDNPGVTYGHRAAAEIGARVVWPEFADLKDEPTDFNDLAQREGIEAVQLQIFPRHGAKEAPAKAAPEYGMAAMPERYLSPVDPASVDTFTPFPEIDGKGKPLPTPTNFAELCNRINAIVRYNIISKGVEILVPGMVNTMDNADNAAHAELMGWCARFRMSTANFDGNLLACADASPHNPVATWIQSSPWDGVSRLKDFYNTVVAIDDPTLADGSSLKERLMMRWMISAIAAAFSKKGVVARGVLTFVSKQNLGKTFWAKRLAPRDLEIVADGLMLDPSKPDSVMECVSNWLVELGEVDATFRRADMAQLKAFISKEKDTLRRPYARTASKFGRRTVFFASVNGVQFLHDDTGNTRWWTINCAHLDNTHTIDMQQVWSEIYELYKSGESHHLTKDEVDLLNQHNRGHEASNPTHDRIDKCFDWDGDPTYWTIPMRATEIALAAGIDKPTKRDVNEAAEYVMKQYGVTRKKSGKDRNIVWLMPARERDRSNGPL